MKLFIIVEKIGKKIPHPAILMCYLIVAVAILSAVFENRGSAETNIYVKSVFSIDFLQQILFHFTDQFMQYKPLGIIIAMVISLGLLEKSNFIHTLLTRIFNKISKKWIVPLSVFIGILSSIAGDIGFLIIPPIIASLFNSFYKKPLLGLFLGFASVSCGMYANIVVTIQDVIMASMAQEVIKHINENYFMHSSGNLYFLIASVPFITILVSAIHYYVITPLHDNYFKHFNFNTDDNFSTSSDDKAFKYTLGFVFISLLMLIYFTFFSYYIFKKDNDIFFYLEKSIVLIIFCFFSFTGILYGILNKKIKNSFDIVNMMSENMITIIPYILMIFFLTQLLALLNYSQIIPVFTAYLHTILIEYQINPYVFLLFIILFTAVMNLFLASGMTKWAIFSPLFIPLGMNLSISPEAVLIAYRIGDSTTNLISPLLPYYIINFAVAKQYYNHINLGQFMMFLFPYAILSLIAWTCFFFIYLFFNFPLANGVYLLF